MTVQKQPDNDWTPPSIDYLNEEVLQQKIGGTAHRQAELVQQYCGDIENRVRTAGSELEARRIVSESCQKFDAECESSAIKAALRQYVLRSFAVSWGVKP